MEPTELLNAHGQPLSLRASPDRKRIDATGKHIMLGMHYAFDGKPLPAGYKVFVHSKPGYDSVDFITENLTSLYEKAVARKDGEIGTGFSYAAASLGDAFIWLFLLYEYFWWIVVAMPPHAPIADLTGWE